MIPRHWYQFADDAAVVTGLEHENQVLLNAFHRWCMWTDMIIRVDKCHSFRMKKVGSSSKQYKPKLYINNELIPATEINESFKYLGRHFDYSMSNQEHKENLCDTVDELLKGIDSLPLYLRNKLLIYHRYLLSKISWDLTSIADISMTWIKQTLDNKVSDYIRRWLEMPISGTLDVISLSKQKCGLGFVSVFSRFAQCQNTIRFCLKNSQNSDLKKIYEKTHTNTNLQYDQFNSTRQVIKNIRAGKEQRIGNELTTQALVVNSIWKHSNKASSVLSSKVITQLPKNIYNFCIQYVNNTLANNTNLHKWGKALSPIVAPAINHRRLDM